MIGLDNIGRARGVFAAISITTMVGCVQAPKPLYHWEGYQRQVYEFLNGDSSVSANQLQLMLTQTEKARAANAALPPGFRAHLGLLYLQAGQFDEARRMLESEKAVFPESAQYMNFLLARMNGNKS